MVLALDWSNSYARRRWRQQQEVGRAILLVSRVRVRLAAEPLLPVLGLDRRRYTSVRDGDAHAGHLQVKPSCGDPPLTSALCWERRPHRRRPARQPFPHAPGREHRPSLRRPGCPSGRERRPSRRRPGGPPLARVPHKQRWPGRRRPDHAF